jgi:hypothetical protein
MADDEQLVEIKLRQRDLQAQLKAKYGHWNKASEEEEQQVRNCYLDYKAAEPVASAKVSCPCSPNT